MEISVQNPPHFWPACLENEAAAFSLGQKTCTFYKMLSGNPLVLDAHIEAVNGIVTRKTSQVYTAVPDDDGIGERSLAVVAASATTYIRLDRTEKRHWAIEPQNLHPSYRVFVGRSLISADYMPGAGVLYIETEAGPEANKAEMDKLFLFDLSCITRLHPCSRHDLMPAAYDQYEVDSSQPQTLQQH